MRTRIVEKLVEGILLLTFIMALSSCKSRKMDSKEVAEEHNDAKFDKADEKDAQFLVDAAEINLGEIQLGQLAQERGSIEDVRELGKSMELEHSKMQLALRKLAAKKTISIPIVLTQKGQTAFRKLLNKNGKSFDADYCDLTVEAHKKAIEEFESNANSTKDPSIRDWANSILPALRNKLDHALICQATCEKQQ